MKSLHTLILVLLALLGSPAVAQDRPRDLVREATARAQAAVDELAEIQVEYAARVADLLTELEEAHAEVQEILDSTQGTPPGGGDPPVDPPPPGGALLRLFSPPPTAGASSIRFCSSAPFPDLTCDPIAWGADGSPSAYLCEGQLLPESVDTKGFVALKDLIPAVDRGPPIPVQVTVDDGRAAKQWTTENGTSQVGTLSLMVSQRTWRFGITEVEIYMEGTEDADLELVRVSILEGSEFYCPDIPPSWADGVLWKSEATPWLKGQATVRRYLVGSGITPEDRVRFRRFEHFGTLVGAGSYQSKGFGPTQAALPRLDEPAVGWDVALSRHLEGHERSDAYEAHVTFDGPLHIAHPEFKNAAGIGPWHPRGDKGGGGSGGAEITPYSSWAMTPGELRASWWSMRTMMERMVRHVDGRPSGGIADYKKHDTAHAIRAMVSPLACTWGLGSSAARRWLQRLPGYYGEPSGFPSEFHGKGHKWAHRALGWHATVWATAYAVTSPGPERVELFPVCEKMGKVMLDVAMPSGITHRAASQIDGGAFTAFLNPDLHKIGKLPRGTTVARTFMVAIVIHGAWALETAVFGDGRMRLLVVDAVDNIYFHTLPPSAHIIVGGLKIAEVYDETSVSELDDAHGMWEGQWALAAAYRMSGDIRYLEQAAAIMGHSGLEDLPRKEFERTGSNQAWWDRSVEVVAEVQKLEVPR